MLMESSEDENESRWFAYRPQSVEPQGDLIAGLIPYTWQPIKPCFGIQPNKLALPYSLLVLVHRTHVK